MIMKISFVLHPNPITSDPDDRRAMVVNRTTFSVDDVIKQITGEGSILKGIECYAVVDAFMSRIGQNHADGVGFQSENF
jgi:hypothetical protein